MKKMYHYLKKVFRAITKPFTQLHFTTPVAVILGALIIGGSILGYGYMMSQAGSKTPTTQFTGKAIDSTDYVEGNKKSEVFLVEYSDPQCPYCIAVHPTMKNLRTKFEGKIAFVYRHFPLTSIHPFAFDESRAIACAGTVGGEKKFYEYIDAIYGYKSSKQMTNVSSDLPTTGKEDIAASIGLDKQAFLQCMSTQTPGDTVTASLNDGASAGVQGTPSAFVLIKNRKGYEVVAMVDGARDQAFFEAAINQALSR